MISRTGTPHNDVGGAHEFPELLGVTFGLREFARLAAAVPTELLPHDLVKRAATVVDQARSLRGRVPAPDDDRVPDRWAAHPRHMSSPRS